LPPKEKRLSIATVASTAIFRIGVARREVNEERLDTESVNPNVVVPFAG